MADWQRICDLTELAEDRGYSATVNGRPLALFLHQHKVYALEDRCPHREGQLSRGRVENGEAICPLHGWNFDLATGVSPYDPRDAIATYPAQIDNGVVYVDASRVSPLPPAAFAGYQGRWRRWHQDARGHHEARRLASGKGAAIEAMGAPRQTLSAPVDFDHFHLCAAQLARTPLLAEEPIALTTVIGRGAGKPLRLALPAYVSHMSFGALAREAKIALARGAHAAGTMSCSGEGGMLEEERDAAGLYVLEMASGYFGWNEAAITRADALEIKVGQSAKPGLGGELPAAKVSAEIAAIRGLAPGEAALSPARFPDLADAAALGRRIAELRRRFPDKPLGIKLVANDVDADLAAALALQPDFITLDGFGGGTGAAPVDVRDHFGLPLVLALPRARRLVDMHNALMPQRPVSLIATGGIRTPTDVAKALALGADACALATTVLFALGCEYYRSCNSGECPVGVATQNPELRRRLDVERGAKRVENFFRGLGAALQNYLRAMGLHDSGELTRSALLPLTQEAERLLQD